MAAIECVVLGLGAMGSAAAFQLARRGRHVLAIDQLSPPHSYGSSHGETRITRLACGEGPEYTQFARRSHQIWRELEAKTGKSLLIQNGFLAISGKGPCQIGSSKNILRIVGLNQPEVSDEKETGYVVMGCYCAEPSTSKFICSSHGAASAGAARARRKDTSST